jgi:hypothetical protein
MNTTKEYDQYEVLNPWADIDPMPLRGISPRLTDLAGKRIGLFRNSKRVAPLVLTAVEQKLKARFPSLTFVPFAFMPNAGVTETPEWTAKFEEWLKGVDAVILSYGD